MMIIPTIKVVSSKCNLSCRYCYYREKHSRNSVMNFNVLESVIEKFLGTRGNQKIYFVWHGGEPLLAKIEFYKKVIFFQKKFNLHNKEIRNGIQTNATLIDERWADFFLKNNFQVGISLDGPHDIQDINRPAKNGKGSFKRTIRGLQILQERGMNPNIISVITKDHLGRAKEFFDFMISEKIKNFHPKPCYETNEKGDLLPFSITPEEHTDFLMELFDIWMNTNDPTIRIRNLYHIVLGLLGGKPKLCEFNGQCQKFLTIECEGSIGACDSFPVRQYYMGNINQDALKKIMNSCGYKKFLEDIKNNKKECRQCKWLSICFGGCLRYSFSLETKKWHRNMFCNAKKRLFSYLEKRVGEIQG